MSRDRWLGVELRHFAALAAIASEGSFRGAADRLGYVQSAVSQQLAALEKVVGARLIERSRGTAPLALTPAGELLLHHADGLLARVSAAKADLGRLADGEADAVRIGVFQSLATPLIPRLLDSFAHEWPHVDVRLDEWPTDAPMFDLVAAGTLDLGFGWLPLEPGPFAQRELLRTPMVLLVAADSRLARCATPPSLAEIARLPLIGRRTCRVATHVEELLRTRCGPLDVVFRSDLNETLKSLVATGLGAALVPRLAVDTDDEDVAVIGVGDRLPPVSLGLFWHRDRRLSTCAQECGEIARSVCMDLAPAGVDQ
jgi:DNA-binding transcriptional LysR family regulator